MTRRVFEGWVDASDYYSVYLRDMPAPTPGFFPTMARGTKLDNVVEGLGRKRVRITVLVLDDTEDGKDE